MAIDFIAQDDELHIPKWEWSCPIPTVAYVETDADLFGRRIRVARSEKGVTIDGNARITSPARCDLGIGFDNDWWVVLTITPDVVMETVEWFGVIGYDRTAPMKWAKAADVGHGDADALLAFMRDVIEREGAA